MPLLCENILIYFNHNKSIILELQMEYTGLRKQNCPEDLDLKFCSNVLICLLIHAHKGVF